VAAVGRLYVGTAFALFGLVATACGDGSDRRLTPPTTITLRAKSVHTGDRFTCKNGEVSARARVPERGLGVGTDADGKDSSASLQLTRSRGGQLVVICTG
jgi:hypothetical protein